jgi:hypothetical protein
VVLRYVSLRVSSRDDREFFEMLSTSWGPGMIWRGVRGALLVLELSGESWSCSARTEDSGMSLSTPRRYKPSPPLSNTLTSILQYTERTHLDRKLVDDVLGGADSWANVDSTAGPSPLHLALSLN